MLGLFYGMSATTILMSSISLKQFRKMIKSLNNNAKILEVLRQDFIHLDESLSKLKTIYVDRELRKAQALLLSMSKNDPNSPKIKDLEDLLNNNKDKKILSRTQFHDGKEYTLLDGSYAVLLYLLRQQDRIKDFINAIVYTGNINCVKVFGYDVVELKNRTLGSLVYTLNKIYKDKKNINPEELRNYYNSLKKYDLDDSEDDEEDETISEIDVIYDSMRDTICSYNSEYYNNLLYEILEKKLTDEEYDEVSEQLMNLGFYGFSIYSKNYLEEFCSVCLKNSNDDNGIMIKNDSPLHQIMILLSEVLEEYDAIG